MKKKPIILALCAFQSFLQAENLLQDACGYEVLSSQHIQALYSWGKSYEVGIGADYQASHIAARNSSGLIINDCHEFQTHYLEAISFDDHDRFPSSGELIAEESCPLKELPSRRSSVTAMGAPRAIK